jgi:FlaA1/EpsC-like NDP-sugar epimerase
VGSGPFAIAVARETLQRPDAGFRVVGFVDDDPALVGKSLINPKVIGLTSELASIVKREGIDRIVVAIADRRGPSPPRNCCA